MVKTILYLALAALFVWFVCPWIGLGIVTILKALPDWVYFGNPLEAVYRVIGVFATLFVVAVYGLSSFKCWPS